LLSGRPRPQFAESENGLQMWRVDENILNNLSRTDDRGGSPVWGFGGGGVGANKSLSSKTSLLWNVTQEFGLNGSCEAV